MEGVKVSEGVQTVWPYILFVKGAAFLTAFPLPHWAISHPVLPFFGAMNILSMQMYTCISRTSGLPVNCLSF